MAIAMVMVMAKEKTNNRKVTIKMIKMKIMMKITKMMMIVKLKRDKKEEQL